MKMYNHLSDSTVIYLSQVSKEWKSRLESRTSSIRNLHRKYNGEELDDPVVPEEYPINYFRGGKIKFLFHVGLFREEIERRKYEIWFDHDGESCQGLVKDEDDTRFRAYTSHFVYDGYEYEISWFQLRSLNDYMYAIRRDSDILILPVPGGY